VRKVRERSDITDPQKKQFLSDNVQKFYGFTAEASKAAQAAVPRTIEKQIATLISLSEMVEIPRLQAK
jgi:hypothetical protein